MAALLSKKQLLDLLLSAVDESGWRALVASDNHPFLLRVYRHDDNGFNLRIYIWNCTHGGGSARADDEYRIQTTTLPEIRPGEVTLLLGWHDGYGVFVGWDVTKHTSSMSRSPSAQVKEDALLGAHTHAFSIHRRTNDEVVVAFRPEFLVEYALNVESLHSTGHAAHELSLLNTLDTVTNAQIESVANQERRTVISQIARKYRMANFRRRVLSAYNHRCAFCGIQLELVDAAHIIPVADPSSTDETTNGIALCALHHEALDRNLVSFDEKYRIEISETEIQRLTNVNRTGGLKDFTRHLKTAIILPTDRRDYPNPDYITHARMVRKWAG